MNFVPFSFSKEGLDERSQVIQVKEVFIVRGQPRNGLVRKGILEAIQETGERELSVYELSWLTGADIFFILEALKELKRAHLISVRTRFAVHWCYPLREVA